MPEERATSKCGPLPCVLRWSAWKRPPHGEMRPHGRSAQDSWAHSRGLLNAHSCTGQALSRQHGAGEGVTTGIMPLMKGRQQLPTEPLSGLHGPACPPNSSLSPLASLLSPKLTKLIPTAGPLHRLAPLPAALFPELLHPHLQLTSNAISPDRPPRSTPALSVYLSHSITHSEFLLLGESESEDSP